MAITVNITGEAVQLTGNPVRIQCTGGSIPAGASNYKILLKVISEDDKLTGAPFIDAIAPDASGEAWFDISGLVDQPVKKTFQYPPVGTVVAHPTQAFNIQVQAGESYVDASGDLQVIWGAVSAILQMLKGGLSPRQISMMNDASTNFYKGYIEDGKFLTPRPWGDEIHPTQAVKLWFMTVADVSADFKLLMVYTDGSSITHTVPEIALNTDFLYEFNCNPAHYGIDLEPTGKKMDHYVVWLEVAGVKISDIRRFHFDWKYCERPIFLFFANSLGGIDDVYFSGYIQDKFNVEGTTVSRPPQLGDTIYDATLFSPSKSGQNRWVFNTGYKGMIFMQFLRDLMLAKQAWYIYSNSNQTTTSIIPILIDNSEKLIIDRKNDLHSLEIPVSEAHVSKFNFDIEF